MSFQSSFGLGCCLDDVPLDCHRWGEALHPGPAGEVSQLVPFGFSNPTGLRNKEEIAVGLGPGVWNFSETHLSKITQKSCASRLRQLAAAEGRNLYAHMGAAVATRPHSEWAGTWSGVTTITNGPSQIVQLPYGEEYNSGKILTTCLNLG